ncbi:hypothetical protein CH63R_02871 [Colletotrichum higginsianum IMI 349063]|uniref:Uncharacterized protein n=1 Tax=Colletotrichum higginsianum (strain IMI 349063) TaxID=759273 RepID=A0A1B7YQ24_COLHI|nr:hypothetical protein CH63R_02871 [Colletotrichum higginsianum IMI 349063]OBR14145.1 hypothetical protein CH63R_02871 [Colletotrichum higginsianum IMI 349063]
MMQSVHTWPPFLVSPLAHAEAHDVWSSLLRAFIEPPIPFTPPDDRDYPGGLSIHMAHRQGRGPRCGGSNGVACGALNPRALGCLPPHELQTVQDRLGSGPRGPLALAPPQHHLLEHCEQLAARERVGESEQGITLLNPSWKSLGVLAPSAWALSSWPWITSSLGANGLIGGAKTTAIFPNFITPPSFHSYYPNPSAVRSWAMLGRTAAGGRGDRNADAMLMLQVPTYWPTDLETRSQHSERSAIFPETFEDVL